MKLTYNMADRNDAVEESEFAASTAHPKEMQIQLANQNAADRQRPVIEEEYRSMTDRHRNATFEGGINANNFELKKG